MRTLKGFLIVIILFYICLHVADGLTYTIQLGHFNLSPTADGITNFFRKLFLGSNNNDPMAFVKNLAHVVEAIIWTLLLFYIIIPLVLAPFTVITPITANYRDTKELRFMRYILLCVLLFTLPTLVLFVGSSLRRKL
jgi:hypothetical protein